MSSRDERQREAMRWVRETFGDENAAPVERARRLLEEALELAQATGVSREDATKLAAHVYAKRPRATRRRKAGGVGVTLLAYCESIRASADAAECLELARILRKPAEHWRARHDAKAAAGVASKVPVKKGEG